MFKRSIVLCVTTILFSTPGLRAQITMNVAFSGKCPQLVQVWESPTAPSVTQLREGSGGYIQEFSNCWGNPSPWIIPGPGTYWIAGGLHPADVATDCNPALPFGIAAMNHVTSPAGSFKYTGGDPACPAMMTITIEGQPTGDSAMITIRSFTGSSLIQVDYHPGRVLTNQAVIQPMNHAIQQKISRAYLKSRLYHHAPKPKGGKNARKIKTNISSGGTLRK
jgi:hypothetical protein